MQRLFGLLLLCSICFTANAQTTKGNFLVGGNADASLSINSTTYSYNVSTQPSFACFVVNNFAVGFVYAFGVSGTNVLGTNGKYKETDNFNTSLGPWLKYYIGKKQIRGVVSGSAAYAITSGLRTETNRSPSQAYEGFSLTGTAGVAYFFNPHLALESGLYINTSGYQTLIPTTRFGVSLGLYAVIEHKKPAPAVAQ